VITSKLKMEKILVGSARHLELDGGLRDLEYLMLNLPYSCNYRCSKCCNASRGDAEGQPLSFEEIHGLITEAKDLGMRVSVIAGEGEPFLDKNIVRIIKSANDTGLIPYIFTNGSQLDDRTTKFLRDNGASLVINLDSLDKEVYEELNGVKGSFQKAYNNIQSVREQFSDAKSYFGGYELRRVAINTVDSHKNKGELAKIRDFCGDDFVFVCNTPMHIGRAAINAQFKDVIPDLGTMPLGTTSDGIWCAYMRNGISVGANGDILMCAYSLESSGRLGNICDGGLEKHKDAAKSAFDSNYGLANHPRCILRDPKYGEFIQGLRASLDYDLPYLTIYLKTLRLSPTIWRTNWKSWKRYWSRWARCLLRIRAE
jgi:organic radical activating enzyme